MSRRDELAAEYADNLYRKYGCSPNTDGKWLTHKGDFLAGFDAAIDEVKEKMMVATANWCAWQIHTLEIYKILEELMRKDEK